MKRKQDGLVPIGEAFGGLDRPVQVIRKTPPPAQRAFTRFDQVNQLVGASGADPDLGFMARLMALCSLHHHPAFRGSGRSSSPGRSRSGDRAWRSPESSLSGRTL